MAIVTRMYSIVGPTTTELANFVDPSAAINTAYPQPCLAVDIDNTDPEDTTTLDMFMRAKYGLVYDPNGVARAPWDVNIQVLSTDAVTPTIYANKKPYIQLAQPSGNFVVGKFFASITGNVEISMLYAMSNANPGNVQLTFSHAQQSVGDDPSAALTVDPAFTFTPGNNANIHLLNAAVAAVLKIAVVAGQDITIMLQRSIGGADTHTGDLRILSMRAQQVV